MDSDVTILGYKEWIEIVTVTKLKLKRGLFGPGISSNVASH